MRVIASRTQQNIKFAPRLYDLRFCLINPEKFVKQNLVIQESFDWILVFQALQGFGGLYYSHGIRHRTPPLQAQIRKYIAHKRNAIYKKIIDSLFGMESKAKALSLSLSLSLSLYCNGDSNVGYPFTEKRVGTILSHVHRERERYGANNAQTKN